MSFIFVHITVPDSEHAKKIADHLLNKKLVGCVSFFPANSSYWWKDKIENVNEHILKAVALKEKWDDIVEEVRSVHPYSVPCIIKFEVESNDDYEKWLREVSG